MSAAQFVVVKTFNTYSISNIFAAFCAVSSPSQWSTRACANLTNCRSEASSWVLARIAVRRGSETPDRLRSPSQKPRAKIMKAFVVDRYKKNGALRLADVREPE